MMTSVNKRIDALEQDVNRDPDNPRIRIIEIWGDRGNGQELLETHKRKAGGWVKIPYENAVLEKL